MCSDCGKGFIHKSSLTFHLWEHKKNPKQKILENSAKKTKKFVEKCGNLLESDDYINVRCKLCDFECKAGRLSTHMRYVHPNEYFECQNDMVTCSHCDEKFSVKRGKIYPRKWNPLGPTLNSNTTKELSFCPSELFNIPMNNVLFESLLLFSKDYGTLQNM